MLRHHALPSVLLAGGALAGCGGVTDPSASVPASGPALGTLATAGTMAVGRSNHTATLLRSGEVLLAGGGTPEVASRSTEIFDPRSGRTRPAASMTVPRLSHTATLLPDGRVLIVGGLGAAAFSAELYDPQADAFRPAASPREPRSDHAAATLEDGTVLFLGGDVSGVGATPTAAAEIYDPTRGEFLPTGRLAVPRRPAGVVRLQDGRVLVAGGTTTGKVVVASAELYVPGAGSFARTGDLLTARHKHAGALLPDGSVLIMGGTTGSNDAIELSSSELYDPASGRFRSAAPLRASRYKTAALTLPDGSVLVAGGSARELAEVYDFHTAAFLRVEGGAGALRFFPTATLLTDGTALIAGGYSGQGSQPTLWRYAP